MAVTSKSGKQSSKSVRVPRLIFMILTTLAVIGAISVVRLVFGISGLLIKTALITAAVAIPAGLVFFAVTILIRRTLRKTEQSS